MAFPIPLPSRQLLREIGFLICFLTGFLCAWVIQSNRELREDKKEQKQVIVQHEKADKASTDNATKQQNFQTDMAKKGPKYVQAPSKSADCSDTTAEHDQLLDLIETTNAVIDPDEMSEDSASK